MFTKFLMVDRKKGAYSFSTISTFFRSSLSNVLYTSKRIQDQLRHFLSFRDQIFSSP